MEEVDRDMGTGNEWVVGKEIYRERKGREERGETEGSNEGGGDYTMMIYTNCEQTFILLHSSTFLA